MELYINTLGEFDIKYEGQSVLKYSSRTYKIFRLFEYFLTFKNKRLLPETIIDNILYDSDSDDPKNMLRTQIFRLRKTINSVIPENEDPEKYLNINFINGYYCLEIGENVIIDVEEFENYVKLGDKEEDYDISIDYYQKAIDLYKGLYLSDNSYEVWLIPTRNYYHRLFLKTLYKLIEFLNRNEEYERIVSICEEKLLIEPYEENIHIELMEALLKLGQNKPAMNHYEHAMNMLEKEMDAKPSHRFVDYINKIQNNSVFNNKISVEEIEKSIEEKATIGAEYCSIDYFKFLFNIQKRKSLRSNENDYLCILTIKNKNNQHNNKNFKDIFTVLEKSLRKGDVFTSWNENQILIMLHDVKYNGIEIIEKRLINNLLNYTKISKNEIQVIFQPLFSEETVL